MAGTGTAHLRDIDDLVLRVDDLVVEFATPDRQVVQAVSGVSFDIREGETLGIVGESGCGKSTVGRAVVRLIQPTSGTVVLDGVDLGRLSSEKLRRARTQMQMIFQDPISSLNPRRKVRDIVAEGISIWGAGPDDGTDPEARLDELIAAVGLDPEATRHRRPHQFSGGQCQRVCIARALALRPKLLICDEPVSALDVSVQAQILNLLADLKQAYRLTMLFIAHDLAVVKNISDRVLVMYLGKICEVAGADDLYALPAHPYTRVLLASIPTPGAQSPVDDVQIRGELPSPLDPPSGCRFRTRCPNATGVCAEVEPQLVEIRPGHVVACHHPVLEPA
ncbi:MAG: ABC transporter ATP-binding protein [Ilumatobacter sp.]|nr:MAG: ABC transporter ATP-binding protein [Ilumatobacter sp.]